MSINCILTGNKITEHDLADELMLPVQNGGLYINSETTQEDKAEAQEALGELGVAFRDAKVIMSATDLNNVIEAGTYLCFEAAHLNAPPLVYGATGNANGWLIVKHLNHGSASGYVLQTFNKVGAPGNAEIRPFSRKLTGGVWSDWTTGFLPLDGSVPMSGELPMNGNAIIISPYVNWNDGAYNVIDETDNGIEIRVNYATVARCLYFNNVNLPLSQAINFWDEPTARLCQIYGEHNKPSGSYTGNGSATTREINIGGIGGELLITNNYGDTAKVTKNGAIINKAGTLSAVASSKAKFVDGKLTLATTETALNENTRVYTYEVK